MQSASVQSFARRLHDLQSYLDARSLPAFVVSTPQNIRYLTGFSGSAGLLVVTRGPVFLLVDGRYEHAVKLARKAGTVAPINVERVSSRYDETLRDVLERERVDPVAVEAEHVTLAVMSGWQRAAPWVTFEPTWRIVEGQRMVKDAEEIAVFRDGAERLAAVYRDLPAIVTRGRTEQEVALGIERALLAHGFERAAFETIVASGPNSALPHARPTTRVLVDDDLVVLDFGGVLGGYCLDLTRMAAVGRPSAPAMALFDAVREAHAEAIEAVRPGIPASDVDRAARRVFDRQQLGDAFLHAVGHGLGLEIHESPRLGKPGPDAPQRLEAGMVVAVEPGAYVEGIGGVRLEDDLLVTPGGLEVLTSISHDLLRV